MKNQQSLYYFLIISFLFCGILQEFWCYLITKTKLRNYIVDIPNSRSSHSVPTPRGGGPFFSLFASISFIYLSIQEFLPWTLSFSLCLSSIVITIVGFIDDLKGLNAGTRFLSQFLIVVFNAFMLFIYTKNSIYLPIFCVVLLFWFIYSLSLINFYNFADGINGYITVQFLISTITYIGYIFLFTKQKSICLNYSLILTSPLAGGLLLFLKNNIYKKSIFMGDSGSTFLGFFLSMIFFLLFIFLMEDQKIEQFNIFITPSLALITWLFFSQIIFFDCACMVIAKKILKIPFSTSHKLHLYQRLVKKKTHQNVTFLLGILQFIMNIFFIFISKFTNTINLIIFTCIYFFIISLFLINTHVKSLKRKYNPNI